MKARDKKTGEIVEVYHESQHGQKELVYKEAVFVNGRMWMEDELNFDIDKDPLDNIDNKTIYKFNGEYELAKYPPKENGFYMTIRCGFSGIYTHPDEWKDGHWCVQIFDGSDTIAYSKERISKEIVNAWFKKKLIK